MLLARCTQARRLTLSTQGQPTESAHRGVALSVGNSVADALIAPPSAPGRLWGAGQSR